MEQVEQNRYSRRPQQTSEQKKPKPNGRANKRVLLLTRVLLIPGLLFLSLIVGLMIGYSVLGDRPVSEVFDLRTFTHMYDLIFEGT
ncbi:DNA-directed RNA polymerase subunit beta [Brevibacillus humidisoli]|uniref:DNA-directed RNA polymerase subunit beta n=1 Tax=Brevibacillus humidisoli TaxID=2895522 RepID=UPI001E62B4BD|nr:DNA-directed RNA polymerase subunit beta [Brevibacillus humidisoli]UFJ40138.1 DNA-directed RNA polymerase subunit beta [Brevibacillus humidisoli]